MAAMIFSSDGQGWRQATKVTHRGTMTRSRVEAVLLTPDPTARVRGRFGGGGYSNQERIVGNATMLFVFGL
jgi:hypothetical protein